MVIDSYSKRLLRGSSVSTIVGERMVCPARTPKGGFFDDSAGPESWDGSGKWMTRKKKLKVLYKLLVGFETLNQEISTFLPHLVDATCSR